jgi:preprotein translocase subunit SecD
VDDGVASGPPPKLEIVRVDDELDVFAAVRDDELPEGEGLSIYEENTRIGPGRSVRRRFVRCALREGEPRDAAARRFRAWLDGVKMPPDAPAGARFGIEDVVEVDDDTQKASIVALRSYLLVGEPVLTNADVESADVAIDKQQHEPYVAVALTKEAAKKFEWVTGEWVDRRLAIVLDGEVESAPVIRSKIGGGRLTITMGRGDPERQLADAKRLERGLNQHRHR